jgi:hypothetical protein
MDSDHTEPAFSNGGQSAKAAFFLPRTGNGSRPTQHESCGLGGLADGFEG